VPLIVKVVGEFAGMEVGFTEVIVGTTVGWAMMKG
jgi:hypothetical protein